MVMGWAHTVGDGGQRRFDNGLVVRPEFQRRIAPTQCAPP